MKTFLPDHNNALIITFCVLGLVICLGYIISKVPNYKIARILGWFLVILPTAFIERIFVEEDPGFRMLSIILVMLFSIKAIVTVETYKNRISRLSFIQWSFFVTGWFGMKPQLFEGLGKKKFQGGWSLIFTGITSAVSGIGLILIAKWLADNFDGYLFKIVISGLLLTGISLMLHFGILNISAGGWRFLGADTRTLFKSPFLSTSLTEFWGKRWNIAFSEMTALVIYRPLKLPLGITGATVAAFLFSGFLHEMAISIPVKAGFGLPLLYFLIHGLLMMIEKGMEKKGFILKNYKWLGRAWVLFWLIIPLPLLFHKAFIKQIIWPIIGW